MKAIEVFCSTIRYLKDQLMTDYKNQATGVQESDIMWVLTVPSIWDDKSRQFMREAAEKVKFCKNIILVFCFINIQLIFIKTFLGSYMWRQVNACPRAGSSFILL